MTGLSRATRLCSGAVPINEPNELQRGLRQPLRGPPAPAASCRIKVLAAQSILTKDRIEVVPKS